MTTYTDAGLQAHDKAGYMIARCQNCKIPITLPLGYVGDALCDECMKPKPICKNELIQRCEGEI